MMFEFWRFFVTSLYVCDVIEPIGKKMANVWLAIILEIIEKTGLEYEIIQF